MKRLEEFSVSQFYNHLFSCREKSLRFQHHVKLLNYYQKRKVIPKGFYIDFHTGATDKTLSDRIDSVLRKCSNKLMTVFKSHYKQKLRGLDREEVKLTTGLKRYHPQYASEILEKLEERSVRIIELNHNRRLRKYLRDGIPPVERTQTVIEPVNDLTQEKCKLINLTDSPVDKSLVSLCSYGPTFVPTPSRVDWNEIQQSWLAFKKKIRWRALFHSKQLRREADKLDPPFRKSTTDPPTASTPAIEVFLNKIEKDLFRQTVYKNIEDDLKLDERKALIEFRSKSIEERDIVIRMQDKGNSFVILDKTLDHNKVIEQI